MFNTHSSVCNSVSLFEDFEKTCMGKNRHTQVCIILGYGYGMEVAIWTTTDCDDNEWELELIEVKT